MWMNIVLALASLYFVSCGGTHKPARVDEEIRGIQQSDYEELRFDRICKSEILSNDAVNNFCKKFDYQSLAETVNEDDSQISSACEDTHVKVISSSGADTEIKTKIGICLLGPNKETGICVSGSNNDTDAMVWKLEHVPVKVFNETFDKYYRCTPLGIAKRKFPRTLMNDPNTLSQTRIINERASNLRRQQSVGEASSSRGRQEGDADSTSGSRYRHKPYELRRP